MIAIATPEEQEIVRAGGLEFRGKHAVIFKDRTGEKAIEGGRDSGKTTVGMAIVHQYCQDFPGMEWLISRYSGTETENTLRPAFLRVCKDIGNIPKWEQDNKNCYSFPNDSKVFAFGLKTQAALERFSKIRGPGVAAVLIDQAEELPSDIRTEMRAIMRQPGYPHVLIFLLNPTDEDHEIVDEFPEDNSIPGRIYFRLSLYDNRHNLPESTIEKLERMYPPTHAKYKSLILGERGPNVSGIPIYGKHETIDGAFRRDKHFISPIGVNAERPILEGLQYGQHHPAYLALQLNYWGGIDILGGMLGKRMYLDEFLPLVKQHRAKWFPDSIFKTCCDPIPEVGGGRSTNIEILKDFGFDPKSKPNSNAPDVREHAIQGIFAMMRKEPEGTRQFGFRLNNDPSMFLMAAKTKDRTISLTQHQFMVNGLEGSYVWDEHLVSVANKKVRQPKTHEWIEGAQRCLENIWLNFCGDKLSDYEKDRKKNLAPKPVKFRRSRWG